MKGDKEKIYEKCNELGFKLLDENFDYEKNRDSIFDVMCLKCGKISHKSFVTLVKLSTKCKYCHEKNRNYHNTIEEVMPLIQKSCVNNDYKFIGFVGGEWKNCRKTKLLLKCNRCGKISEKNYDNLVNKNSKCICYRTKKAKEKNVLKNNEVKNTIEKVCTINEVEFISFENKENEYFNNRTKLKFKCKKCGNIIRRSFYNVRQGNTVCECCHQSSLEKQTKQKLIEKNILFEEQKKFSWLKSKNKLSLDFYLQEYKIAIECQGKQHFEPIEYFGGQKTFDEIVERDKIKKNLCLKNGVKILYVKNSDDIEKLEVK